MNDIYFGLYKTSLGTFKIASIEDRLCLLDWAYRKMRKSIDDRTQKFLGGQFIQKEVELHHQVIGQIEEYAQGDRQIFDLPLRFCGTDFQQSVWKALMQIPYGQTVSYQGLSEQLGNPLAIRAIASANGANGISIIVPCHRVIGSNGKMVGYAGGLAIKKKLLKLEGGLPDYGQLELF